MSFPSRDRDYGLLEQELKTTEYLNLLFHLQRGSPFLCKFPVWADVIAFMRQGTSQDPLKDDVLRPILASHTEDGDPRWRTVLLVIFWPGLLSLHYQKRLWDKYPDELWNNITWTFLEVVSRIDVKRRPNHLTQKVINDTAHHLHDEYRRIWDRSLGEEITETEVLVSVAAGPEMGPYAMFLQREEEEKELRRLQDHLEAGRITEVDFHLIVGTRLYGRQVTDLARELGLAYQAAKKRRQRAEVAIRRFYEGNNKT